MVAAHFTLVFPFEGEDESQVAAHASAVAARTPAIDFSLCAARAVRDPLAPRSHVFLLPRRGDTEIRQLHAALYSGLLARHLRADIPFAPHITVSASPEHETAEAIAAGLNPVALDGRLEALQLVAFDGRRVTPLFSLPLAG